MSTSRWRKLEALETEGEADCGAGCAEGTSSDDFGEETQPLRSNAASRIQELPYLFIYTNRLIDQASLSGTPGILHD
jgi:hypothetical protein